MQFGIFLYKRGIISAEAFVDVLEYQQRELAPLGLIALEEGRMAIHDLLSVLRVQSDLPHDRFGEIAIEMGFLTDRDLAELLMIQANRRPSFAQALVALDLVAETKVAEELAAFRRIKERGGVVKIERFVSEPAEEDVPAEAAPVGAC